MTGEWLALGERSIYESRWVKLNLVDVVQPDGRRFEHHVVRMQRVVIGVVTGAGHDDEVLMLKRHRFIDKSWGWEFPVGIVEPDEADSTAILREIEEETGWRCDSAQLLLAFQPTIGIADSVHSIFRCQGAQHVGDIGDMNEAAEVAWIRISQLLDMVESGDIRDGATLVGALHLLASRRRIQ